MKFVKAFALLFALVIVLSGCSVFDVLSNDSIETLEDWSFQYNDGTKDYSLFFALCNDKGKNISSDATVDIKIINSAGDIVFQGKGVSEGMEVGLFNSGSFKNFSVILVKHSGLYGFVLDTNKYKIFF